MGLIFGLLLLTGWTLSGGLLLWLLARYWMVSPPLSIWRAAAIHALSIPGFVLYAFAGASEEPWPDSILLLICLGIYYPLLLRWLLRASLLKSVGLCALSILVSLSWISVFVPHVDTPGPRPRISKANGEMRSLSTALNDYFKEKGQLPIPVNERGERIQGTLSGSPDAGGIESATEETLVYYRGPSFVPQDLLEARDVNSLPTDPFDKEGKRPYGYGVGPLKGDRAAILLSSYGPDRETCAEELEALLLEKHRGDVATFKVDPEMINRIYSPTNGTRSPGDLVRPTSVKLWASGSW